MKAAQLKALLSKVPDDAEVYVVYEGGFITPDIEVAKHTSGIVTLEAVNQTHDVGMQNLADMDPEVIT